MSLARVHVSIRGRVQAVGFRAWVQHTALGGGLEGWVRNRRDGSVEALFVGPAEKVSVMVGECRKGPSGSRVTALDENEAAANALDLRRPGDRFSVLPTV